MSRTLYFDAFSGLSGDMLLGAFIELGLDLEALSDALSCLDLGGWSLSQTSVLRQGVAATHVSVNLETPQRHHRTYADIRRLINSAPLSPTVSEKALGVFEVLAHAESQIHGQPINEVHFHEVGCVDSIIDIVGSAWCLDALDIDTVLYSALPMARGWVKTAHGKLPLPAPATAELMTGMSVVPAPADMEWVTPTGAAILKALGEQSECFPTARLEKLGLGAGSHDPDDRPNILRACLFTTSPKAHYVELIQTNLDDTTAEEIGFLIDRLWSCGPLDVWVAPVLMKKNRPGQIVSILCTSDIRPDIIDCLYAHSSTFGVRYERVERDVLDRRMLTVSTAYGDVAVKLGYRDEQLLKRAPEYEDCARLARENGVSVRQVYQAALDAADV